MPTGNSPEAGEEARLAVASDGFQGAIDSAQVDCHERCAAERGADVDPRQLHVAADGAWRNFSLLLVFTPAHQGGIQCCVTFAGRCRQLAHVPA